MAKAVALFSGLTEGTVGFARGLAELGMELWASAGTAQGLAEAGVPVRSLAELTGEASWVGGRVKTLHPAVHAAILAREGVPGDLEDLERLGAPRVDLVAVVLYPFAERWAAGAPPEEVVEALDVGGVALLRAAAKNHRRVTVVADPQWYGPVLECYRQTGGPDLRFRAELAADALARTSRLDAAASRFIAQAQGLRPSPLGEPLRYGENPHQAARLSPLPGPPAGLAAVRALRPEAPGLSYTNLIDLESAWRLADALARGLGPVAAAAVKHASPVGAAVGPAAPEVVRRTREGDPRSAYGGVLCLVGRLDREAAREVGRSFWEVVAASTVDPEAVTLLGGRWPRLRVLELPAAGPEREGWSGLSVDGVTLWQELDDPLEPEGALEPVAGPPLDPGSVADLRLALACAAVARSNAAAVARRGQVLGVGAGFPNRVEAVERAVRLAREGAAWGEGAVLASDAFFPFADGVEVAAGAGIRAVAAPLGSVRDEEVLAAAQRLGITFYRAPRRHFRH